MSYSLFKLQSEIDGLVRFGLPETEIVTKILDSKGYERVNPDHIKRDVAAHLATHKNYRTVQRLMDCYIIRLQDDGGRKVLTYNPHDHSIHSLTTESFNLILEPKCVLSKTVIGYTDYNPRSSKRLQQTSDGRYLFNVYMPPQWAADYFHSLTPIPYSTTLPDLYQRFFTHLNDGDAESLNYMLHWAANSLHRKNMTALAALGEQGIGKGIFATIMNLLHGYDEGNSADISGDMLKSQFNGMIENKTFVHFDEAKISTEDEVKRFKSLINAEINIEKKGVDARKATNYANIYLSANNMDHIKVPAGDRRFSFLNLTKTKMVKVDWGMGVEEFRSALLDPSNITQLAHYLWHFNVDQNLLKEPFYSATLRHLRKASLYQWEKEFLSSYCSMKAGKSLPLTAVFEDLEIALNTKLKLSARSFEQLQKKLGPLLENTDRSYFTLARVRQEDGSRPFYLQVAETKAQPAENFIDDYTDLSENG